MNPTNRRIAGPTIAVLLTSCGVCVSVEAQDETSASVNAVEMERPRILANRRWEEDWSVLANPAVAREPWDRLKYLPFSPKHPRMYVSFGINFRERAELDHAPAFGTLGIPGDEWLLSRVEGHMDLRLGPHLQVFTQLQSAVAPGKRVVGPVDKDRLDVEQAFVGFTTNVGEGTVRLRVGRQLIAIELQRFASVRDGPNLRQSYDAAYADYESGRWRVTGAYTQPVQVHDQRPFDDTSDRHLTFSGLLLRRRFLKSSQFAVSYTHYTRDDVVVAGVHGDERRNVLDIRVSGGAERFDWDLDTMKQIGTIGSSTIDAGALGALVGYTLSTNRWVPRIAVGVDVASGDRNAEDGKVETFNPLFPNGYYLAGYTGFPNLIHVKPAVTVHPARALNVMIGLASQWRRTAGDAVYVFPDLAVPRTSGRPGRHTGSYAELRGDWTMTPHYSIAFDAVHFVVDKVLRQAGGTDATYVSAEVRYGW